MSFSLLHILIRIVYIFGIFNCMCFDIETMGLTRWSELMMGAACGVKVVFRVTVKVST